LTIFHAGSLSVPFGELTSLFKKEKPDVTVLSEAAGSRDLARKVSDLGRSCDVLGSADYKVIENLLMPEHAGFNIRFATNEMCIAYTEKSQAAKTIDSKNWPDILLKEDVAFGRSDSDSDPCGYRTEMLFQLAEKHYKRPGLANNLAKKDGHRFIRPKETDLLALLEAEEIDYLFIYRSVAVQHGLDVLRLPDEINLRAAEHSELYSGAKVEVTGKKPGQFIARSGAPIMYSVTIPKNTSNSDLALEYLALLLSPKGQLVMERNGQSPIVPATTTDMEAVPARLRKYLTEVEKGSSPVEGE
jgi:molybdate/tungstate transport system substrate-binding protein